MKPDEVLHGMSYRNLVLYSASIPHYDDIDEKNDDDEWDDSIDACNPENIKNIGEDYEEYIK